MRLRTIWTLPGLPLRERLHRSADWFWLATARHLPRRIAYWSFVVEGTRAIKTDVTYMDLFSWMDHR